MKFSLFTVFFLVACSEPSSFKDSGPKDRMARLNVEERQALAPNALFIAVINADLAQVEQLVVDDPSLLEARNDQDGNTALGVAIQFREPKITEYLMDHMTLESLQKANTWGEGYIFLLAREGYVSLIQKLADSYYRSVTIDYEFGDLDFPTQKGQTALFVAKNRSVIEALEQEYYRGLLEMPFYGFAYKTDNEDKNFLHMAALRSNVDVLRWANERFCATNSWEQDGGMITGALGYLFRGAQRGISAYTEGLGMGWDSRFNWQDILEKMPLHYAAEKRNLEAVQVIASCQWTSFDREDINQDIPLQSFLKSLDESQNPLSDSDRQIFQLLSSKQTKMKTWFWSQADYINHQNHQKQTALHLAARLADDSFYQALSQVGDVELQDGNGQTPKQIHASRQARVKSHGQ